MDWKIKTEPQHHTAGNAKKTIFIGRVIHDRVRNSEYSIEETIFPSNS